MDNITSEPETATGDNFFTIPKPAGVYSWYPGVLACVLTIVMAGVPGNLLTILAYFKYNQLHSPTNLLICSQSIGDLFTCLLGPLHVVLIFTETGLALLSSHKYLCLTSLALLFIGLQSSVMNIIALCTERFIAVYFSLHYYNWVTDVNVKRAVAAIWTVVILINCLPVIGWNTWEPGRRCLPIDVHPQIYFQGLVTIPGMLCLMICAVENGAIAFMAVRRQRSIAALIVVENAEQQTGEANIKRGNQFKVTKMILLVVGCFYAAWLPWIVFNSIFFSMPTSWKDNGVPERILMASEYAKALLAANTVVNPFIYGWKNLMFRDAYYKLLGIRRTSTNA